MTACFAILPWPEVVRSSLSTSVGIGDRPPGRHSNKRWSIHFPKTACIRGLPFIGGMQKNVATEAIGLEKGVFRNQALHVPFFYTARNITNKIFVKLNTFFLSRKIMVFEGNEHQIRTFRI